MYDKVGLFDGLNGPQQYLVFLLFCHRFRREVLLFPGQDFDDLEGRRLVFRKG